MAEYIEREVVLNILASKNAPWNGYQKVSELPAADVQPVKWIPVEEKLPEKKGNYLVVFDCGHGAEVHEAFFFKYFDSWEWYDPVEEYQKYDVTHWTPLPEPPKDGET